RVARAELLGINMLKPICPSPDQHCEFRLRRRQTIALPAQTLEQIRKSAKDSAGVAVRTPVLPAILRRRAQSGDYRHALCFARLRRRSGQGVAELSKRSVQFSDRVILYGVVRIGLRTPGARLWKFVQLGHDSLDFRRR